MKQEKNRLRLHVPSIQELWYRRHIMGDPATMAYNRGYDLPFEGYDPQTGCLPFPDTEWADWYAYFIGQEPERYYAYIMRKSDGAFLGEVNLHKSAEHNWHEMGIVLEARYRGMGYSTEALSLLLKHAFNVMGADAVHNDFESSRLAALHAHLTAGFSVLQESNGVIELVLTREQYSFFRQNDGHSKRGKP